MQAALPPSWPCRSVGRCQHGVTHLLPSLAKGPRLRPSLVALWLLQLHQLCRGVAWGMQAGRGSPPGDGGCWAWMIPR